MQQNAISYNFAIIGEAVTKLSPETVARYPEIEWQSIKGFRNIIVHAYFSLDLEIVWEAAMTKVQPLADRIREIVREDFPVPNVKS